MCDAPSVDPSAHDMHVHTTLSACCHDDGQTARNVLARAAELGLHTVGFADHMWENPEAEPSRWYAPQNLEHVLGLRDELAGIETGVRALVGCEADYAGPGRAGISPEAAAQLDFVLLPCSHFHMKGFVDQPGDDTPAALARHMTGFFRAAVATGLATVIPHPFVPCGHMQKCEAAHALISDGEFAELFARAVEAGVAIEIHPSFFPGIFRPDSPEWMPDGDPQQRDDAFIRMLTIARGAGVRFTLASDAHARGEIGATLRMRQVVEKLGLTACDFLPLAVSGE